MTIQSQRHYIKFGLTLFVWVCLCSILAFLTGILHTQATSAFGEIMMFVMSGACIFLAFYRVFRYYKNAPTITINEESISIGKCTYSWKDLEKIEMTGKRPFKFMGEQKESILLKFKGENEIYIFDDMYENSPEIKALIEKITNKNQPDFKSEPKIIHNAPAPLELQTFKYYKGNFFLGVNNIMIWAFILFFLIFFSIHRALENMLPILIISGIGFILNSFHMNYFGLSDDYLLIKNHTFFWTRRMYPLANIKEVVFEQKSKRPITLRIITSNFESKIYPACTLLNKNWKQFKEDLESKNINVRSEAINFDDYEPIKFKFFND